MENRRDSAKASEGLGGDGGSELSNSIAARGGPDGTLRMDFQTFLPKLFDGKPFGPGKLEAMADEAGVARFVVFPEASGCPDNRGLAERIRSHPRIIGCASVNPTLGNEAVKELELSVAQLGLKGVRLSPIDHRYPIDDRIVDPVLEKACDLGVPITTDGEGSHCTPARIAAVAGRFPGLTIIVDMGFRGPVRPPGEPAGREMVEVMHKYPNLFLGFTPLAACQPSYLMSTIWAGGPDRVVFGSHAPSGIPLFAAYGLKWANLDPDDEALIFGENLKKIYKLA